MQTEISYNQAVAELEGILARIQRDDCGIGSLSAYTARALELLKLCKEKLFKTDAEVKKCLEALKES